MSHVEEHEPETADQAIRSLYVLGLAAARMGGRLIQGQTTYKWFGQHMKDYPIPEGRTVEDLGKCEHAIAFDGVNYEVGVVKSQKFPGTFSLVYDWWDSKLKQKIGGKNAELLMQLYQVETAKVMAKKLDNGQYTETADEEGNIIVEIDTTARIGH